MGENFIGSHISLVTKSDLRYEGILTEIDIAESTITLKNVRAYGDEGRRPNAPQPPGDRVYELILFKADDIQDLTVITQQGQAPPAPAPPAPSNNYPGSYNYGAPPPAQPPAPQPASTYNQGPWGPPAAAPPPTQPYAPLYGNNPWSTAPPAPAAPAQPQPPPAQARAAPPPPPPAAGGTPAVAPTVSIAPKTIAPKEAPAPPAKPSNWAQAVGGGRGHAANGAAAGRGAPAGGRGAPAAPGRAPMAPHHVPARTGVPAGPPGQPRPAPGAAPAIPVPAEDYDFEAANNKFKKEELAKEAEEGKEPVYKKDDFFDLLSCEALGHHNAAAPADWRAKMMEQKRLDMETFGGLGGVRHTSFGRGRGGRGGPTPHGGQQGGRGGGMQGGGPGRGYGGGRGDNRGPGAGRGGGGGGGGAWGGRGGQGRGGGRGPRNDNR